ncbi:hypothetical protein OH77DRAFT_1425995, partial [Trametes cingulata]
MPLTASAPSHITNPTGLILAEDISYTLWQDGISNALCLSNNTGMIHPKNGQAQQLWDGKQKWHISRMAKGWALQNVATGLFLGIQSGALGGNMIMTTCPTTWTLLADP